MSTTTTTTKPRTRRNSRVTVRQMDPTARASALANRPSPEELRLRDWDRGPMFDRGDW